MRLIFMGPPGGGKGTQAARVAKDARAVQVATGDDLRAAVAAGTPAGKKAQAFMGQGKLVPDALVNEVLRERLDKDDARDGWILDGYPRTAGQAEALDALLAEMGQGIEKVLLIDVPFAAIEERVLGRRTCKDCQAAYHIKFNPPASALGRCDRCGGELYQRADDSAEKLRTRLEAFSKDTLPVAGYYGDKGLLARVAAGTRGVAEVEALVRAALGLPAVAAKT